MATTKFCRAVASPAEASSRTIMVRDGLPWTPASQFRYRSTVSRTLAPMLSKICVASIHPQPSSYINRVECPNIRTFFILKLQ